MVGGGCCRVGSCRCLPSTRASSVSCLPSPVFIDHNVSRDVSAAKMPPSFYSRGLLIALPRPSPPRRVWLRWLLWLVGRCFISHRLCASRRCKRCGLTRVRCRVPRAACHLARLLTPTTRASSACHVSRGASRDGSPCVILCR